MRNTIDSTLIPPHFQGIFKKLVAVAVLLERATQMPWKMTSYLHHHGTQTPRPDMHRHGHCLDIAPDDTPPEGAGTVPQKYEWHRVAQRSDPCLCYMPWLYEQLAATVLELRKLALEIDCDIDVYVETDHLHIHLRPTRAKIVQWARVKSEVYPDSTARHEEMRARYQPIIDAMVASSRGQVSVKRAP